MKKLVFAFFIFTLAIYFIYSSGKTPYDYFTRLSDAFLSGKYYLTQNPPQLNELIPAGPSEYYVAYPPMPAILSIPFRYLFGDKFQQQYLAEILGAGIAALTMLIAWKIKKDKKLLIWTGLLTGFGNIIWYLSSNGSAWYLGQISAAFFLTGAIFESINKKRAIVTGILLGGAFLSRIELALTAPLFLYIYYDKQWLKNYFLIAAGFLPFVLTDFAYNFIRFGVIWDKAYILIPGVMNEIWYKYGIINPLYIPRHLKVIFLGIPKLINRPPFIEPSWAGLAIWFTTPAFIYAFLSKFKENSIKVAWGTIILISLLVFSHGTTGFTQFGYRFAVDFYPILFLLTIKGVAKTKLKWHHWILLSMSILVNLWGVLWINKFGWVTF